MPVPQSARGNPITSSAFEAPFETPVFPYGIGGLDLASPLDKIAVGRFARLTNLAPLPSAPGQLPVRPGMTEIVSGTGNFHSAARLSDPAAFDYTYVWGVGTTLAMGIAGAVTVVDPSGYSNEPMTLLPYHPPLSGDPWMFVADRDKMTKVRFDGLVLPWCPDTPTAAPTCALGTENTTPIASFTSADATAAANWTGRLLTFAGDGPSRVTYPGTATEADASGNDAVIFTVTPGATAVSLDVVYAGLWGLAKTLDLSLVGPLDAEDADAITLEMAMQEPRWITEVRVYFVVSEVFSTGILPGTTPEAGPPGTDWTGVNSDFYMKSFRPDDFANALVPVPNSTEGGPEARTRFVDNTALVEEAGVRGDNAVTDNDVQRVDTTFLQTADPKRARVVQASTASLQQVNFGTIGIPLRRGDFRRYGNAPDRDWATVTGILIFLSTTVPEDKANPDEVAVRLAGLTLTGGSGPDTMDAATQSYDFRYTNYDPRTGDESNPSPEMADDLWMDAIRRSIVVQPTAYGEAEMRQRFYRRGGVLVDDWYYLGENASDGGVYTSEESDLAIAATDTLELDNYAPVPTVNDLGETVLGQPIPIVIGPYNGQLFGLGDPYRPGFVYASKPGEPDHWPPDLIHEVCSPSEELMNMVMLGQILCWSRDACYILYPNLVGSRGITSVPAGCARGLQSRWALCLMDGVAAFVSEDGVFTTNGGPEECISDDIAPLFRGISVNGYTPIDLTEETTLRLTYFNRELYLMYREIGGAESRRVLVYSPLSKQWRAYDFAENVVLAFNDEQSAQLIYGLADRASLASGLTDNGTAIAWLARTGSWDWGRPREEKLFGDQFLDCDAGGAAMVLQNFINTDAVTNPAQAIPSFSGRRRVILDSFGTIPQRARNLAVQVSGEGGAAILYQVGTAITAQPDITINRVTNWDDLGHPDSSWVMGITLDADTAGEDRTLIFERDYLGVISTLDTVVLNSDGRHKTKFSWTGVPANQVRIRPDNDCGAWICYRADWIAYPEPPMIARWDTYFENQWDQYITGLDLMIDTNGLEKTLVLEVDGNILTNPATGDPVYLVTASGKQVVHLDTPTMPPLRGHVLRFYATDENPGQLYSFRWHTIVEPSEQANWNQPFSIFGTQADKYLKALVFEIDTFDEEKTVAIEVDGVIVDTLVVQADGRKVVQIAFPQVLGRVYRIIPTDNFPSRLYTLRPVFDEEPFQLTRWETQELDHGLGMFQTLIEAQVTLKSTTEVTLTIDTHTNQLGAVETDVYTIPSTTGVKQMRFVPFVARKGVLFKYVLTAAASFHLYKEESHVIIQPFIGGQFATVHVWGNSDTDATRSMVNSTLAAGRSGGGTE